MAQECGFFNAELDLDGELDREYLAEQFAAYFASFIGNGIFGKSMQKLEVVCQATPDMSIQVLSGEAWINGWWYRNTDVYNIPLQIADGLLSRIDAIVVRWGSVERDMWLHVITGDPSRDPKIPAIRRDADYWDLMLGYVTVSAGSINITQSKITDTRLDNSVCGLVTGVVDQIDMTDLYNQFTAYFNEFKAGHEKDFDDWSAAQKQAYLDYVAFQKGQYDAYIASLKADYDTWTADKKAEWTNWVADSEAGFDAWLVAQQNKFINWTDNEMFLYEKWTTMQKDAYETWFDIKTNQWQQEFYDWFNSIKAGLDGFDAGSFQDQLYDLQVRQPTEMVADIEHNLGSYVHCDLYQTTYAAGMGGAGVGPAGGSPLVSSPCEYELADENHIKIKAMPGFGEVEEVKQMQDKVWTVLFKDSENSLIAVLDDSMHVEFL